MVCVCSALPPMVSLIHFPHFEWIRLINTTLIVVGDGDGAGCSRTVFAVNSHHWTNLTVYSAMSTHTHTMPNWTKVERMSAISHATWIVEHFFFIILLFAALSLSLSLARLLAGCKIIPEEIQRIRKPTHANTKCFNYHVFVYIPSMRYLKPTGRQPTHTHSATTLRSLRQPTEAEAGTEQ